MHGGPSQEASSYHAEAEAAGRQDPQGPSGATGARRKDDDSRAGREEGPQDSSGKCPSQEASSSHAEAEAAGRRAQGRQDPQGPSGATGARRKDDDSRAGREEGPQDSSGKCSV